MQLIKKLLDLFKHKGWTSDFLANDIYLSARKAIPIRDYEIKRIKYQNGVIQFNQSSKFCNTQFIFSANNIFGWIVDDIFYGGIDQRQVIGDFYESVAQTGVFSSRVGQVVNIRDTSDQYLIYGLSQISWKTQLSLMQEAIPYPRDWEEKTKNPIRQNVSAYPNYSAMPYYEPMVVEYQISYYVALHVRDDVYPKVSPCASDCLHWILTRYNDTYIPLKSYEDFEQVVNAILLLMR